MKKASIREDIDDKVLIKEGGRVLQTVIEDTESVLTQKYHADIEVSTSDEDTIKLIK